MKEPAFDFDTPTQKAKKSALGGKRRLTGDEIDRIWAEVRNRTRNGLGWQLPQIAFQNPLK